MANYRWSKDINNNDLDVDNFLINNGGVKGIPPQLLKGQMFSESYKKDNSSFWPTYRYEPWQDRQFSTGKYKVDYKKQPYWVNENGMGVENGGEPVPITHQNVRPILSFLSSTPYPNLPMKIGVYVADNFNEYYSESGLKKKFSGPPMYAPSKVQNAWGILVKYYSKFPKEDAIHISNFLMKEYLMQTFSEYAQTRKAASYGYFQMLYTTAILKSIGYPAIPGNYPAPENLSDQYIQTPYILKHLLYNLKSVLKSNGDDFDKNNWENGFEQVWVDSYYSYNKRSGYGKELLHNASYFLPKKDVGDQNEIVY